MMRHCLSRHLGCCFSVWQRIRHLDRCDYARAAAPIKKLSRLPNGQPFFAQLQREAFGVSCGRESFRGQDGGSLVMAMLARCWSWIHGHDYIGTEGADKTDQAFERLLFAPFSERGREAFGVGPIQLIQKITISNA